MSATPLPEAEAAALWETEAAFWRADAAFYARRLAPACVMVFPGAGVLDRASAIAGIADGARWDAVEMTERHASSPAEGTALLVYLARASRAGEGPYAARVASLYVRRDAEWALAFHQHTPAV